MNIQVINQEFLESTGQSEIKIEENQSVEDSQSNYSFKNSRKSSIC